MFIRILFEIQMRNVTFIFYIPSDTEFELRRKRLGSVIPKEDDLHGAAQALIR